ncbi:MULTISPECIES: PIG-L deacetylase family protein [unclassified Streptomyces]|uniref:PIG-L deacetylase family protein n=1 Tax=unclassified Streptomyces TaxID=2593676 RepID=UPI002E12A38A|nr:MULTISPECIES: PIG-L deacetylase family protein [unclassified Streptomyces]WSR29184.1 PIG-L family deacetylase [Streptomyces sp. NBC_01205]
MTHVLIVAAHPDDAELALGGTIAHLTDHGTEVTVALFTVSETAGNADPGRRARRIEAAEAAAGILGHRLHWLGDGHYDQVEDVPEYRAVGFVDDLVARTGPDTVISHWDGDSHGDHVRVARAVIASSRRWPHAALAQFGPNEHRTVRHAEFVPNLYVPTAGQLARKARALACHRYPGQGFRALDTDAVELFDRARGAAVGLDAAEGLRLVRHRFTPGRPLL